MQDWKFAGIFHRTIVVLVRLFFFIHKTCNRTIALLHLFCIWPWRGHRSTPTIRIPIMKIMLTYFTATSAAAAASHWWIVRGIHSICQQPSLSIHGRCTRMEDYIHWTGNSWDATSRCHANIFGGGDYDGKCKEDTTIFVDHDEGTTAAATRVLVGS